MSLLFQLSLNVRLNLLFTNVNSTFLFHIFVIISLRIKRPKHKPKTIISYTGGGFFCQICRLKAHISKMSFKQKKAFEREANVVKSFVCIEIPAKTIPIKSSYNFTWQIISFTSIYSRTCFKQSQMGISRVTV